MMHCVSSYPLDAENVNFKKMNELKKLFNDIGYSGHFSGIDDAIIAICLGAKYIEKHFTIDKALPGRDNKFAINEKELLSISKFKKNYVKMNMDKGLDLQKCEEDIFNNYRGRWSK
jgi:sialic acid synthase SpsE